MKIRSYCSWISSCALLASSCGSAEPPEDINQGSEALSGTVLFVTGSTSLNAADTAVRNRLSGLGFIVQVKAANAAVTGDASGKALVVISSTVFPDSVGTKFRDVAVPVLTWESQLYDEMRFTSTSSSHFGTQSNQTGLTIGTAGHPVAAGLMGNPVVSSSSSTFNWGTPAPSATRVGLVPSNGNRAPIFAFEQGAPLFSGNAPARRVGFFLGDTTATSLNTNGWALFDASVTWAVGAPSGGPSTVKLTVSNVDDFLYLTVNGVQRKLYRWHEGDTELDVTPWFGSGSANEVKVQVVNTGGPASYSIQLAVDGQNVIDEVCANAPCDPAVPANSAIVLSKTYQINTPNLPPRQTVSVSGTAGAKLYIDNAYTGRSVPTTFSLPAGSYTFGAGVSQDVPPNYTGQFFERSVQVAGSAVNVDATQGAPLPVQNTTRIAILPVRTTIHGAGGPTNTGVLEQSDIDIMHQQTIATRDGYTEPFSYGLTSWNITVLPTVENVPLYRPITNPEKPNDDGPDTEGLLNAAGLQSLKQSYDIIEFIYSNHRADGSWVEHPACCYWGGGQVISMTTTSTRYQPANAPNVWLLHETLHSYESYNAWILREYNGIWATHGAEKHGYWGGGNGEFDFIWYYRHFMRGQVHEIVGMNDLQGVFPPPPPPSNADVYIGVFPTMRKGVAWPSPTLAARSLAANTVTRGPESFCALPAPLPH